MVIEDDATGSVETSGVFDPATDGLDFYESLEGMRVQVNDALAVGPRNGFGEIPVVGDQSALAGVDSVRGGVLVRPEDFNPERIILDDTLVATPVVNVGDGFAAPVLGVMDYSHQVGSQAASWARVAPCGRPAAGFGAAGSADAASRDAVDRELLRELLKRERRSATPGLRPLAQRVGVL